MFSKRKCRELCEVHTGYPTCDESNPHEYLDEVGDYELIAHDDNSGLELDPSKVQEARKEEITIAQQMDVWEVVPRPADKNVISVRLVDLNKGDHDNPNYRSTLVVRELEDPGMWSKCFAGMPSLAAFKMLICFVLSESWFHIKR